MVDDFEESKLLTSIHYEGFRIRFGKVDNGNYGRECGSHAVLLWVLNGREKKVRRGFTESIE